MIYKKIMLDETDENAYLTAYVADKIEGFTRKAILVIPGGGYCYVCNAREGEPIAQAFMPLFSTTPQHKRQKMCSPHSLYKLQRQWHT